MNHYSSLSIPSSRVATLLIITTKMTKDLPVDQAASNYSFVEVASRKYCDALQGQVGGVCWRGVLERGEMCSF